VPVVDLARMPASDRDAALDHDRYRVRGHTQGFLVEGVDTILRLDWSQMKVPPEMLTAEMGGLVTAVTELPDGRLVMMMDVEKVLVGDDQLRRRSGLSQHQAARRSRSLTVFFADDSIVARKQIMRTLDAMHVKYVSSINGRDAWNELEKMAAYAEASGQNITDLSAWC
jgi:two-component system chemotaxis response regulator CheV